MVGSIRKPVADHDAKESVDVLFCSEVNVEKDCVVSEPLADYNTQARTHCCSVLRLVR